MGRIWPVIASVFGPGVAQMLFGRRRIGIAFVVAIAASLVAMTFTIYALPIGLAIQIASVVETIVYVKRTNPLPRARTLEAAIAWTAVFAIAGGARIFLSEAFKIPSSNMYPTLEIGDHVLVSKLGAASYGDLIVFEQPCYPEREFIKRLIARGGDTVEIRCNVVYVNGKAIPNDLVTAADTYFDRIEDNGEKFERHASRYREKHGGHTYEVFHDPERPERGLTRGDYKDFPLDRVNNCDTQQDVESRPSKSQMPGKVVDSATPDSPCKPYRHYVVPEGHVFTLGDNRSNSNDSRFWGSVPTSHIKGRVIGIWLPVGRFGAVD